MNDLENVRQTLEDIKCLLLRLPEIQAAVLIQMWEQYQSARMMGKKASDLWEINLSDSHETQ